MRKRPDLTANRQMYQGTGLLGCQGTGWACSTFDFTTKSTSFSTCWTGTSACSRSKTDSNRRFAPQKITFGDLQQFIGMLHRSGLVISNSPGQGKALREGAGTQEKEQGDDGQVCQRLRSAIPGLRSRKNLSTPSCPGLGGSLPFRR